MKDAPGTRDYDWWLLAILAAICTFGVIEIYSATHGSSLAGMHMKQIRWLVIGFALMFALSRLDYHLILDQAPILYLIGIVALIAVLAMGHYPLRSQTLDSHPRRILSGVRIGKVDYNHCSRALLCGSAHR